MIRVDAPPCSTCGAITVEVSCVVCALEAAVTPEQRNEVWRAMEKQRVSRAVRAVIEPRKSTYRNLEASPW